MLVRRFTIVVLALAVTAAANTVYAQTQVEREKSKTLIDRLDDLGDAIFGGILPPKKTKTNRVALPSTETQPQARQSTMIRPSEDAAIPETSPQRRGSVLAESGPGQRSLLDGISPDDDADFMPENMPPAVHRTSDAMRKPVRRSTTGIVERPVERVVIDPLQETADVPSEVLDDLPEEPVAGKAAPRALHERLSALRRSAFGTDPVSDSETLSVELPRSEVTGPKPIIARRNTPEADVTETAPVEAAFDMPGENEPAAIRQSQATAEVKPDDGVLFTQKGPVLGVETLGPRQIRVGRESTYEVSIVNSGEVAAEGLVIFVSLPQWAEVANAGASRGDAQTNAADEMARTVRWSLGHLDAKGRERLTLRIIPRESRPFDLAVRWEYEPVASQAMIEVQEPKLVLQLHGPREVVYGKKGTYRLRLTNTGNGSAENVALMLMPIGGGENVPATYKVGTLPAGEEKVLDVELTARQAGNLTIQVDARADGGVHAELAEKVLVRRAELQIDVEGPKVQFVGTTATYAIRVRNPGTAAAQNVDLSVVLPAGAQYLAGVEGARLDESENRLHWTLETISPEVEQRYVLKCSLGTAGMSRIEVNAAADDDLTTSAAAVTRVEAVADLTMEVKDPKGPVAVGEEAEYEVRVRNRGTKQAEGIEVFGYFSQGIEPTEADGGLSRLEPGQVRFQPIAMLAPGAEAVFTIRARADTAGNHVFRTEVHCKSLGSRLINEATSLYYADGPATRQTASEYNVEGTVSEAMRTVPRPVQDDQVPVLPRK